eukprot:jgi/Phyca11/80196/gw1.2.1073.1
MTALRRDRLFERVDDEDLNLGGGDWLLPLDSDTEGDEDTVLMDKDESDGSNDEATDSYEDDNPDDDLELGLDKEMLDELQRAGWETYDEHTNSRLHLDASPLYDGPYGPTKAALAYAESPLAMFYFFLPKELWRKIAEETNKFREERVDDVAQSMRARARQR